MNQGCPSGTSRRCRMSPRLRPNDSVCGAMAAHQSSELADELIGIVMPMQSDHRSVVITELAPDRNDLRARNRDGVPAEVGYRRLLLRPADDGPAGWSL